MKNYDIWIKKILAGAGLMEIVFGLSHFAMPYFAYQSKGYSLLNHNEIKFITLCIFSLGIILIAFGILTILLSTKVEAIIKIVFYYTLIKAALWTVRIILGILYPVDISLFFIEQPNIVVFPLLLLAWFLFVFPVIIITLKLKAMSGKAILPMQ